MANRKELDELADYLVHWWHTHPTLHELYKLHEFMDMTRKQYGTWVMKCEYPAHWDKYGLPPILERNNEEDDRDHGSLDEPTGV